MPRALSRITLEVTDVRVERVQSITEEDARWEGVELLSPNAPWITGGSFTSHRAAFFDSWDRTYPGSWKRNDWVWAVSFKRMEE